jgi:lipopolysaccharide biosynthesis glycosyltransferase
MSAVVADIYDQPGCIELNSGLMVIIPSEKEYQGLISLLHSEVIKKLPMCGDQDIIRLYFKNWSNEKFLKLPNQYNMYFTNIKKYKYGEVSVVHFVYDKKPWNYSLTAWFRRMLKFNAFYLFRYMLLVYSCKIRMNVK